MDVFKMECLVVKAMELCECDSCKNLRQLREISLNAYIQLEVNKILYEVLKGGNKKNGEKLS